MRRNPRIDESVIVRRAVCRARCECRLYRSGTNRALGITASNVRDGDRQIRCEHRARPPSTRVPARRVRHDKSTANRDRVPPRRAAALLLSVSKCCITAVAFTASQNSALREKVFVLFNRLNWALGKARDASFIDQRRQQPGRSNLRKFTSIGRPRFVRSSEQRCPLRRDAHEHGIVRVLLHWPASGRCSPAQQRGHAQRV